jgi:hypothetical protein
MATDTKVGIPAKMQLSKSHFEHVQQWERDFAEILSSAWQSREVSSADRDKFEQPEANRSATVYMSHTTSPTKAQTVRFQVGDIPAPADPKREKEEDYPKPIGELPSIPADTRAYSAHRLSAGSSHEGIVVVPLGGMRSKFSNVDLLTALSEAQAAVAAHKRPATPTPADRAKFRKLADHWVHDTEGISVHSRAIMHRAYQQIIGMGTIAIPLLLEALRDQPDHWMWALSVLSDEDPARNARTFMQARAAWLRWGDEKGYIGD